MDHIAIFAFLSVSAFSLFAFVAVAVWSDSRRKEREAFYKSETMKKMVEAQGAGGPAVLELLREEARLESQRRREGIKLGGLVTMAVGFGLGVFLGAMQHHEPVQLIALIPFLVGLVLVLYAYFLAPKD